MELKKTCKWCNETKDLHLHFYKKEKMKGGYLNKCIECVKLYERERGKKPHVREYDRRRYHTNPERKLKNQLSFKNWALKNPEKVAESKLNWIKRNPEKRKAHIMVWSALRSGKLIKKPCEVCGKQKVQAHHSDYTKPLEVQWLCTEHHAREHQKPW